MMMHVIVKVKLWFSKSLYNIKAYFYGQKYMWHLHILHHI